MRCVRTGGVIFLCCILFGCARESRETSGSVRIDLDKSNQERLLDYYLSGYGSVQPFDPFEKGLVSGSGTNLVLNRPEVTMAVLSSVDSLYQRGHRAGGIDWDLFESWVSETWYEARSVPPSVDAVRSVYGDWSDEDAWFHLDVRGSMSPFERHIAVRLNDLWAAMGRMETAESPVVYPIGTLFIGEHVSDSAVIETTLMVKRSDGDWDFFAYGEDGQPVGTIRKDPDPLKVPTNCIGCHFGSRLFEPEKSYPGAAQPGPNGPRELYEGEEGRNREVAASVKEHARRSDTVLGLYVTVYLSRRMAERAQDQIDPEDRRLLERLGL